MPNPVGAGPHGHPGAPREPLGTAGPPAPEACKCGAALHPEHPDRCTAGHVAKGNLAAVVVGERSVTLLRQSQGARQEIAEAVLRDLGFTPTSAPEALLIAATTIAQATLLRDAAFARLAEAGGPMSSTGRTRRAFVVWCNAADRLERHLRLVYGAPMPTKPGELPTAKRIDLRSLTEEQLKRLRELMVRHGRGGVLTPAEQGELHELRIVAGFIPPQPDRSLPVPPTN